MRGTSTAATRRPSPTTAFRKPRILWPPPATASAAAPRIPTLRPYTPPVTHGGWTGSSLTARTSSPSPRITYTGDSSSTYGVTASTMSAPPSTSRPVARYPPGHLDQRLGHPDSARGEARPLSAGQDQSVHATPAPFRRREGDRSVP